MTEKDMETKDPNCIVILPASKKAMDAVGIEENRLYAARFEDGLWFISDLMEGFEETSYKRGKDAGYVHGYEVGYEEAMAEAKEHYFREGYRNGYDDAVDGVGYRDLNHHVSSHRDCGLDCDYDCETCRYNKKRSVQKGRKL